MDLGCGYLRYLGSYRVTDARVIDMPKSRDTGSRSEPGLNASQHAGAPELNEYSDTNPNSYPDADKADFGPESIAEDDMPQEVTESYGTGVKDPPGMNIGGRTMQRRQQNYTAASPELSGGDVDAAWTMHMEGEEMVGGTVSTPDQDIVDDLGVAMGTEMRDREDFYGNDKYSQRDAKRWDLDPASSEDYSDRREGPAHSIDPYQETDQIP
jgi:hypothetical protein